MNTKKGYVELLEMAITREIEAINFYLVMAEMFVKSDMGRVFIDIANEEMNHKNDLELEVMKCGRTIDIEHDFASVSISDANLPEKMLPNMDYGEFLLIAIKKEDAAFRFYVDMLTTTTDPQSREVLMTLAQEEARHKYRFEIEYEMHKKKE